ncbi:hypothetical protein ACF0H5_022936 [Mactra antiquata]
MTCLSYGHHFYNSNTSHFCVIQDIVIMRNRKNQTQTRRNEKGPNQTSPERRPSSKLVLCLEVIIIVTIAFILYAVVFRQPQTRISVVTKTLNTSYDYIIVGGGPAGSVLASRLSEDSDKTVLLLEAGDDYVHNEDLHKPIAFMGLQKTAYDWQYYTVPQKHSQWAMKEKRSYWPSGRVLGGSGMLNSMQYARGCYFEYDFWESSGCKGWSYKHVLPYFKKSEDNLISKYEWSKYHSRQGRIAVSEGGTTPLTDLYLQAGREMKYEVEDLNGEVREGFDRIQTNIRNGVRSSAALEFLGKVAGDRENLHIGVNSFVTKIQITKGRAQGVYVIRNNKKYFIKANKEVISSAGAVRSPQLLMLSGIGPEEHLESLGIEVIADLPVGENLRDHVMIGLMTKINSSIGLTADILQSWTSKLRYNLFGSGPLSTAGVDATALFCVNFPIGPKSCRPDIQFNFFSGTVTDNILSLRDDIAKEYYFKPGEPGIVPVMTLLSPLSSGTITLNTTDPYDSPLIDPNYLDDERDVMQLLKGIELYRKLLDTPAMKSIGASMDKMKLSVCKKHKFDSEDFWECILRHLTITSYHPAGTCRMGPYSETNPTVVDPKLRVHGIKGLRVVDASIMPTMPAGNLHAPVVMIAEKAADMIRGKKTVLHI